MSIQPAPLLFSLLDSDSDFPTALQQTHPPVRELFGLGSEAYARQLLRNPGVAVVGSRQATAQGCADAMWFSTALSKAGLAIISGLAQGIDAAAHRGGLSGQGKTAAILGNGLDLIYPRHHTGLAKEIHEQGGCLLTEYPAGTPARPQHFPNRNRIIAGLCRAVLVVEAMPKSGSLITARHALDLGIDVYVVPGSIHLQQSAGCNQLIRQGAQPVQSPEQLLEDLGIKRPAAMARKAKASDSNHLPGSGLPAKSADLEPGQAEQLQRLLGYLNAHPQDVDALGRLTGQTAVSLYGDLLLLELMRLAVRTPDGRWLKISLL
jgi:DNA processing protein